jgi:UDP-N-acetylglucosamine 2-epimerase (non-hydrolysing)
MTRNAVVIAGARPNFVKIAPLLVALDDHGWTTQLVHTGQHYDEKMSQSFFTDLGIRKPDVNLEVGSGSHGVQTGKVMTGFESWLENRSPDVVIVAGDVNSTVACTLVAAKSGIPVAHVEAGLRSFDRSMPEEINRLVVDALGTWLLTPSADADANLAYEGAHPGRVHRVGNIMADSLFSAVERARERTTAEKLGLGDRYGLVTLHRPALVDKPEGLRATMAALNSIGSSLLPLVFPVHPRTRSNLDRWGIVAGTGVRLVEPLGYLDFIGVEAQAMLAITDSGGVQEETTCLGVPCLTLRSSTERPITISEGTNRLIGLDPAAIAPAVEEILANPPQARKPDLWDGHAAHRIVQAIETPVPAECWAPYNRSEP